MTNEFKKISQGEITRYVLETATGGGTSAGSVASVSMPMGVTRKRGDNLLAQEGDKKTVPATTPRNFVAKNAKTSGAGAHKDKKKAAKQGKEKHKKPFMEDHSTATGGWGQGSYDTYGAGNHGRGVAEDERDHPDHEIQMASSELLSIAKNAESLLDMVRRYSEQEGLDAWQQSKITKAADYLNSVLQSINGEQQGVAEGADDKFSAADKVEELVDQYRLYDKKGWTDLFTNLAGRKLEVAEIRREMEYASKFLDLLDGIRMRSDYRGQQDPRKDQELIDLSNQWLSLLNKATSEFKGMGSQGVAEGSVGLSKDAETNFHAKLDQLVHATFGKRKEEQDTDEDMSRRGFLKGAGAMAAGISAASGAQADNQTDPNKLIAIVNIDGESKEFNLTGRFKGDVKSQLHQAEDFITEFLEKRDINFSNLELRYQGAVLKTQNTGSVKEDDSALNAFLSKGGKVQQLPYKKPRKADKTDYGSKHIGGGGDKMKSSRTGTAAKTQGSKVVGVAENAYFELLTNNLAEAIISPPRPVPAGGATSAPGAVKPAAAPAAPAPAAPAAPAPAAAPSAAPATPAAPAPAEVDPVQQKIDQTQQSLLDRMGKRFGLPPGSSQEDVKAAQQAHLDKTDPAAAAQYKQNMDNIEAGGSHADNPAVQLAPKAAANNPDDAGALSAGKANKSPIAIMLAQPTIANNPQMLDIIAPTLGLPAGSTIEQILAADDARNAKAGGKYAASSTPAPVAESLNRAVDSKGRTQKQWFQLVKSNFPDAKIRQSKMIDGPCFAILPNGKKLEWGPVEQGVAEGAKVDRQAKHITASMMKKGKSKKDAESIAWAHIKHPKNESVDSYFESLQSMVERQLEPTMDLDTWVDNFQNADPNKYHQFKNKTPEKKK